MWVPVVVRRVTNCYTPFTLLYFISDQHWTLHSTCNIGRGARAGIKVAMPPALADWWWTKRECGRPLVSANALFLTVLTLMAGRTSCPFQVPFCKKWRRKTRRKLGSPGKYAMNHSSRQHTAGLLQNVFSGSQLQKYWNHSFNQKHRHQKLTITQASWPN